MKAITTSQMRELEREAHETYGIPLLQMMEKAGKNAAACILSKFKFKTAAVFCGKGSNGGDGFIVAQQLYAQGKDVIVILPVDPAEIKEQSKLGFDEIKVRQIPFLAFPQQKEKPKSLDERFFDHPFVKKADFIVDALIGTGIKMEIAGVYKEMIDWINSSGKPVAAIDVPSGLDADDGSVQTVAVKAAMTVSMVLPKIGFEKGQGPAHCGEVKVVDIGVPAHLVKPLLGA